MRQNTPITVIACGIFSDELQAVIADKKTLIDIIWIEPALHTDLKQLEAKIDNTLAEVADTIHSPCVLFGSGCLPGITDIFQSLGARILPVNNCIDAFLGSEVRLKYEAEGSFLLTPGWIRAWPSITASMGWDEVDVKINLGRYKKVLVFDAGIHPLTDEEVLGFFDHTGLVVEIIPLDLSHFSSLIDEVITLQYSLKESTSALGENTIL